MKLPTDSKARKGIPMFSGLIKYFPLALAKVASVSQEGNDQHNPGKPLHWDRSKSKDQMDALVRHVTDVAIEDGLGLEGADETLHALAQVAWRALAELQLRLEKKSMTEKMCDALTEQDKAVVQHLCGGRWPAKQDKKEDGYKGKNPDVSGRAAETVKSDSLYNARLAYLRKMAISNETVREPLPKPMAQTTPFKSKTGDTIWSFDFKATMRGLCLGCGCQDLAVDDDQLCKSCYADKVFYASK